MEGTRKGKEKRLICKRKRGELVEWREGRKGKGVGEIEKGRMENWEVEGEAWGWR